MANTIETTKKNLENAYATKFVNVDNRFLASANSSLNIWFKIDEFGALLPEDAKRLSDKQFETWQNG